MDNDLARRLVAAAIDAAEDSDRIDTGHTTQWQAGYVAGLLAAVELALKGAQEQQDR